MRAVGADAGGRGRCGRSGKMRAVGEDAGGGGRCGRWGKTRAVGEDAGGVQSQDHSPETTGDR